MVQLHGLELDTEAGVAPEWGAAGEDTSVHRAWDGGIVRYPNSELCNVETYPVLGQKRGDGTWSPLLVSGANLSAPGDAAMREVIIKALENSKVKNRGAFVEVLGAGADARILFLALKWSWSGAHYVTSGSPSRKEAVMESSSPRRTPRRRALSSRCVGRLW